MAHPCAANDNTSPAHEDRLAFAREVRRKQAERVPQDYREVALEARRMVEALIGPIRKYPAPLL